MTPDLTVYTSNRLEILAEHLALAVRQPLPDPVWPELVVVQSRGMARWVSMELARHNGICANFEFPFPNAFLQELSAGLIPEMPDQALFDPAALTFRLMKILPECLGRPGFEDLKGYLEPDDNTLKLLQISGKIADLFDQYLVFRPEMVLGWEQGGESDWQAQLWRELFAGSPALHRARLQKMLFEKIRSTPGKIDGLPARVSVFGISYLPPFYFRVFVELSRTIPVTLFLMNPCREYWSDIASESEIVKLQNRADDNVAAAERLYLESGNRLLASMGGLGRDFFKMVTDLDCRVHEHFEEPVEDNLLSAIQSDVLRLKDRPPRQQRDGTDVSGTPDTAIAAHPESDDSIQIHSCHSPMREIEILHDNLLAMFEKDPELLPEDIVVMTPDIESCGPYIKAVFGAQTDEGLRIPFNIADQSVCRESRIIDGFLSLLNLPGSRFSAPQIVSFLEIPSIRDRFDLSEKDIGPLENWIKATGIRWGVDGPSRARMGLPDVSENTWRAGIERLLLGYAMPGMNRRMFSGILPYDHIEGRSAEALGKLLEFLERLFRLSETLLKKKTLVEWHATLFETCERFFAPDEASEREMQILRRFIGDLKRCQDLSGFDRTVGIEVVRSYLKNLLEREDAGTGFITSGVTFCAMLPMRSIPFKVICLVGMNIDAFPRETKTLSFDLMRKNPRIGDRSRRSDDRYLFLEALISARKKLYISYVGHSLVDNTVVPPSVFVSEVLDYVMEGFGIAPDQLTVHHRLQGFSPAYFNRQNRLFSYSRENLAAAVAMQTPKALRPLVPSALFELGKEWKIIDIEDLCAFFANPARFLLRNRLGIHLTETEAISEETESFRPGGLERYLLGRDLVDTRRAGSPPPEEVTLFRAQGRLPHGNVGQRVFDEMCMDADAFVRNLGKHAGAGAPETLEVDLEVSGFRLFGKVADIYERGLVQVQYADLNAKHLLSTWIYHLVLSEMPGGVDSKSSLLVCKNAAGEFGRVENGAKLLEALLGLYWKGMSAPLHFFPGSSYAYARRRIQQHQSTESALTAARSHWLGGDFARGEAQDPYYELCFRSTDPLNEDFQNTAQSVFGPLLENFDQAAL